jgi:hypothetical protein
MSINLIRFLDNQRRRAERYRVDTLRYRGVEYVQQNNYGTAIKENDSQRYKSYS